MFFSEVTIRDKHIFGVLVLGRFFKPGVKAIEPEVSIKPH